ncbi:tol-pal system protein YbgF [Roseitalea porphyridii]|uniref:tol-pal system protein YbgF n=1 Tax=Roseitalea porphyridii TaxID=1852022 RepID=UPI0013153D82|nr:tol-pal system protein YbgF [Roseitalea porphyridii]
MTHPIRFMLTVPGLCLVALATLGGTAAAQINDPRILQLEEQVRQLTGRVEELNFQLLQMQEQMRRQQEDNEFRFQQLETQQQGAVQPAPAGATDDAGTAAPATGTAERVGPPAASDTQTTTGTQPRDLGSLRVDEQGNVLGADIDFSEQGINAAISNDPTNAISGEIDPEALYRIGYEHVLDGDYAVAEQVFERFVSLYPDDQLAPDARFWLGESVLAQGRFEDAAEIFIDTRARHPQAGKAAETMLKIGTIMAALGDRNIACVTFEDALRTHPEMGATVRQKIEAERAKAQC